MRLTYKGLVALVAAAVLAAITIWGPTLAITTAWLLAALVIVGVGLGMSPSVQLHGRVDHVDSERRFPRTLSSAAD
jgi:hypothetical protein